MSDDIGMESYLREWVGDILGRFALDETSVTEQQLIEAVNVDLTMSAETLQEIFDSRNWFVAELFCTP